jgi:hypothetical protein
VVPGDHVDVNVRDRLPGRLADVYPHARTPSRS